MEEKTIFELCPDLDDELCRAVEYLIVGFNLTATNVSSLIIKVLVSADFVDSDRVASYRFLNTLTHMCEKRGINFNQGFLGKGVINQLLPQLVNLAKERFAVYVNQQGSLLY